MRFADLPMIEGATGKFLLQQMAAVAELEAGMISARTKAALAAAKRRGAKLGGDRDARLTAKARIAGRAAVQARARNRALDLAPTIQELQAAGCASLRAIAAGLEQRGIPAPRGGNWSAVQVARLLEAASIPFGASAGAAEETSKSLRLGEVLPNRSDCPAHNHLRREANTERAGLSTVRRRHLNSDASFHYKNVRGQGGRLGRDNREITRGKF